MSNRTASCVGATVGLGIALAALARTAAAGSVVVCAPGAQAPRSVDLYEAREFYGYDVVTGLPTGVSEEDFARKQVARLQAIDSDYAARASQALESVLKTRRPLPAGTAIVPQPDSFNLVFPQGCEVKEATIYGPDYGLRYDADLWLKLDPLEHAALLTHEAVYRVEKDFFNATHSITARKIVGRLFSSQGLDAAAWREIHPAVHLEILPESWIAGPLTGTDAYGTTHKNVTRAYYVRNSSTTPSSDIALAIEGVNAAQWKVTADTCRGQVLASRASCRVEVTFLAETPGTLAGAYSAMLKATGDAGATALYGLTGSTAYTYRENWPDSNLGYPTYDGTTLPASCSKKGDLFMLKVGDAPRGTQSRRIHLPEYDGQCPAGQWYMEAGRGSAGTNAPGELRECGVAGGPTWRSNAGNGQCGPAGVDVAWASTSSAIEGSCDISAVYIVDFYYCE